MTSACSVILAGDATDLFSKECASCHGKDGKAQTPVGRKLGAKDLSLSRITDGEIEKQISEGKKAANGPQAMPPFKSKLTPEQTKDLVAYVKLFRK